MAKDYFGKSLSSPTKMYVLMPLKTLLYKIKPCTEAASKSLCSEACRMDHHTVETSIVVYKSACQKNV